LELSREENNAVPGPLKAEKNQNWRSVYVMPGVHLYCVSVTFLRLGEKGEENGGRCLEVICVFLGTGKSGIQRNVQLTKAFTYAFAVEKLPGLTLSSMLR
jgi:hypothetical protein